MGSVNMTHCSQAGDCITEAVEAGGAATPAVEELAGCLQTACIPGGSTTTEVTTTSSTSPTSGPAVDLVQIASSCPSTITTCNADPTCTSALGCMKRANI